MFVDEVVMDVKAGSAVMDVQVLEEKNMFQMVGLMEEMVVKVLVLFLE